MTDRKKIMIFEGGPHNGSRMEWTTDKEPPPMTHSFRDKSSISLYRREEITPDNEKIEYIYEHIESRKIQG